MSPVGSAGSGKARWACWPDRRPNWFDSAKKMLGLPLFSIRADLLTVLDSELPAWQGEQIFLRMNSTSSRWKATSAAADHDPRSETQRAVGPIWARPKRSVSADECSG